MLAVSPVCFFIEPVQTGHTSFANTQALSSQPPASSTSLGSTPEILPPPAPTALHPECAYFVALAAEQGWRKHIEELERLAWRESRCLPHVTNRNRNGTTDWGVLQINDVNIPHLQDLGVVRKPQDLFDPEVSIKAAKALRRRDGGFCSWYPPAYC